MTQPSGPTGPEPPAADGALDGGTPGGSTASYWQSAAPGQAWQPGPSAPGGYLAQPGPPAHSAEPVQPGHPADPGHQAQLGYSGLPGQPVAQGQPVQPVYPGQPVQPLYQAQPVYPGQPVYHGQGYPGQPGLGQPDPGHPWIPLQPPIRPSVLPVEPREYHEFLRTPNMRWWRPIAALAMAAVLFLVVNVVVSLGAMVYDMGVGNTTLENYSSLTEFKATPAFFFANNVGLALCIPIAVLTQWACFGQRPRWMMSVLGTFRWRWFGECVVWMLPFFLLGLLIDLVAGGAPQLQVSASTGFMIAAILLTTPLQAAGEEFLLRGLGQRAIGAWLPRTVGLAVSTAITAGIFMMLHGAGDIWLNVFYLLFAVTASVLAWRTGGLEAPIAMHLVNNMVAMTFLPFMDISDLFNRESGAGSPWVLTHMVIMVGAAALVLRRAKARSVVTMSAPGATPPPSAQGVSQPIPQPAFPAPQPWRHHDGNQAGPL